MSSWTGSVESKDESDDESELKTEEVAESEIDPEEALEEVEEVSPYEDVDQSHSEVSVASESSETVSEQSEEGHNVSLSSMDEMDESEDISLSEDSGGEADTEDLVPSGAITIDEMVERERRWKILVWGKPGLFKSHFAYTMPEPIVFIDLEGKADDISHKFKDKEVYFWQPETFREAQENLSSGLDFLEERRKKTGDVGSVVIDSMGLAWEWAKTTYKRETNPMKSDSDLKDVTLSSNIGSSKDSDWQHIKGMHNSEFRKWMIDSDFHFLWTAGEKEDYATQIEDDPDVTPLMQNGEKDNEHKADSVLRAREGEEGEKIGDLTKSNFTDSKFVGLERPTFDKLKNVIEDIEEIETTDRKDKKQVEDKHGVEITRGSP